MTESGSPEAGGARTSSPARARTPERRTARAPRARAGDPDPVGVTPQPRTARRRPLKVPVRDRRLLRGLLLAASKGCPAGTDPVEFVRRRSDGVFDLSAGVVYSELHRLEKERLIEVTREVGNRGYTLTEAGERVLAARRREWESLSHGLSGLLGSAGDDVRG